ncbi:MAG: hypothetical protein HY913_12005 [Desulfomonile tiedjei]|nr:hypothetical protein [Desulfomonile tiedjei]
MRSFLIAAAVCIVLAASFPGKSDAVGLYAVGKEGCKCSPLVARGIIPDPLNQLSEAFAFSQIAVALDRVAVGIKGMADQLEAPAVAALPDSPTPEEDVPALKEKEEKEAKPAAVKKKTTKTAKAKAKKKVYKKKRVPVPTRAL